MPSATPTAPRMSPIQRSQTAAPFNAGSSFGGARPGFFGGGGFGRGLLGGFLGAGLFGMLFGGGLTGGLGGGFSLIGLLLQVGLLFLAFRFIMGFFRNRQPAFGGTGGGSMFGGGTPFGGGGAQPASGPARPHRRADHHRPGRLPGFRASPGRQPGRLFERRCDGAAAPRGRPRWPAISSRNWPETNARASSTGSATVHLVSGDLSEAWREGNSDFATVAMRFSLIDVTMDQRTNQIVSGDASAPQNVTEVWTFTRPTGAGPQAWMLSAIQQA